MERVLPTHFDDAERAHNGSLSLAVLYRRLKTEAEHQAASAATGS